jgi:hypothetical protein
LFIILVAGIACNSATAQDVPVGQWKDYLSYRVTQKVCQGPGVIYCTSQEGIFSYNLGDNSLERYNKVSRLSDVATTVARYSPENNALVIGYFDGNIDILQGNQLTNMPDMLNAQVQGSKYINDIYFYNNYAYISCGQGILQVDLSQYVIDNTFSVSSNGSAVNIRSMTVYQDTIFAATDKGVYKGYIYDANLNDYADWQKVTALPNGIYNAAITFGNQVLVNYSSGLTTGNGGYDTLYTYSGGKWSYYYSYVKGNNQVNAMQVNNGYLTVACQQDVKVINSGGSQVTDIFNYGGTINAAPSDAFIDVNNNIWIADRNNGLVKSTANNNGALIYPPGPASNYVTDIKVANNNIWIAPGGYNQSLVPDYLSGVGISSYQNGNWYRTATSDTLYDLSVLAVDPANPLHCYVGSWGRGVEELTDTSVTHTYMPNNSTLQNQTVVANFLNVRVGGEAFDTLGNLWVTNSLVYSNYLSVLKANGQWDSIDFSALGKALPQQLNVVQIIVTKSNAKWILLHENGILVYQDNGTFAKPDVTNSIVITTDPGNGALPDLNVTSIAQDLDGTVWVGTDASVVAFYTPDNVLDGNHDWDAQPIYVTQNGYTQYLMQNQLTTAITIDGANRKWLGTEGGGAFLMSPDGTQQVYNFTSTNSRLLSNIINCITINQNNGEVFFGTDQGIVSFRGTATGGGSTFSNVYAFPNPVPRGYDGYVAIRGLVTNSDVKITTANGELVYHTTALGGQAIWDGNNFSGTRVKTGVYLVFSSSPDGSQSHVTKLLLLN